MPPQSEAPDPHFTVFVRLPFPRGDFVDPPPPNWTAAKDRVLWEVLLQPSKAIDWNALANHLDVTLPFLLQQAAWLYGHRLSQVRAEMLKAGQQQTITQSPTPISGSGSHGPGGYASIRGRTGGSPAPSRLSSQQREGPGSRADASNPPTPVKTQAPRSRTPSSTIPAGQDAAIRGAISRTPRPHTPHRRGSSDRTQAAMRHDTRALGSPLASPSADDENSEPLSSSSSESDSDSSNGPNLPFKRFGRFSLHRPRKAADDDEEDEEDSPAFLPLEAKGLQRIHANERDQGATLRQELERGQRTRASMKKESTTASTSTTSSGIGPSSSAHDGQRRSHPLNALSPRRAAELARSGQPPNTGRSDGTPSMGSSFSDLDDASVTQSALEEALLSNMQHGGVASRMSTLSQALRSRYL